MISDQETVFSSAQAVTAAAGSTNYLDLGPLHSGNTYRNFADGMQPGLWVVVTVVTTLTDGGSNTGTTVTWRTDSSSAFGGEAAVFTIGTFAQAAPAGTQIKARIPAGNYKQYNRLYYTPNDANLTGGAFTAQIVRDVPNQTHYHSEGGSNAD